MENQNDKILEVKNLRISFKTNTGTVKAVRGIDFSLTKGKTLAIVGESGSGKSVTSKAILGILANNKIIEDGQIIYDGKDLLKLSEEQFTKIRGVKISMIFQDPLSSLNPIMKVGKQLTEAMFLKAKATKKEANVYLNKVHKIFETNLKDKKEDLKKLFEIEKNCSVNDDALALIKPYSNLFSDNLTVAINNQKEEIKIALNNLENFKKDVFANEEEFSTSKAKVELKKFNVFLKKCVFSLQTEADDVVEVFNSSMNFYIDSYEKSIKQTQERAALLEKYQVNDIYALPASVRAGHQEVIVDKHAHYLEMLDLIEKLNMHLNYILNNNEFTADKMIDSFMDYYANKIIASKTTLTKQQTKDRAIELLKEVGINDPERRFYQYPFEFSGGMRQRIVIAIALSSNPEVLICDEPTTALDVTIQAQILELINKLKAEKNLSIIFITHDLGVVANMADRVAVMYAGKIVEYGLAEEIFYDPRHPYTWALLSSIPDVDSKEKLESIPGTPPDMVYPPKGDAFSLRSKYALKIDFEEEPPFFEVSSTHYASTWLLHPSAPKVEMPDIVKERIKKSLGGEINE